MVFIVNGETYKTQKDNYLYHNVAEYHEKKRTYYCQKYRKQKKDTVRKYVKYATFENNTSTENMCNDEF